MTAASAWIERWRTARALGIGNVARVAAYRGMKRTKLAKWLTAAPAEVAIGDLFRTGVTATGASLEPDLARYFSRHHMPVNGQVPWLYDPFADESFEQPERHWSEIPDFVRPGRDIKAIWELSRFDWVLTLARAARGRDGETSIARMNALIRDWQEHNPPFLGPNWKCGQETTIRMLQTLLAASLLDQDGVNSGDAPSDALMAFVEVHTKRIAATINYALAQDNNHSISEATGLYIAGAWLARHDKAARRPKTWHDRGHQQLERLASRLFAEDGSFSQYSVTYHRFVIDMLSQAEWWRRRLGLPSFSEMFYARVRAGIGWLYDLTDPQTGDAPNVGSNDGARLFVLSETDYRDFRPSVQLAMKLFEDEVPFPEGEHDRQLDNLGLTAAPWRPRVRSSRVMADGGFVLMLPRNARSVRNAGSARSGEGAHDGEGDPSVEERVQSWGCLRFPSFAFRPSHADALHLDLWVDGTNLLRDSGSYSYNPKEGVAPDLRATAAHNTIEFDGRDQMPRLGRFLFGSWLKASEVGELIEDEDSLSWTGAYRDAQDCHHRRTVTCSDGGSVWRIRDEIAGQREKAVLRWRLAPGDWSLDGIMLHGTLGGLQARFSVDVDQSLKGLRLVDGKESRYYLELATLPVLEVNLGPQARSIETIITLFRPEQTAGKTPNMQQEKPIATSKERA